MSIDINWCNIVLTRVVTYLFDSFIYAAITFSDSEGNSLNTLTEQQAPHRLCINLNGPPSGGDLTVTISPGAATSACKFLTLRDNSIL